MALTRMTRRQQGGVLFSFACGICTYMSTSPQRFKDSSRARFEALHRPIDAACLGVFALSPLMLGGTHPIASVLLCALMALICGLSISVHTLTNVPVRRAWPVYLIGLWVLWVLVRSTVMGAWTNPQIVAETWAIWPDISARGGMAPGRAGLWTIRTLTFALAAWYTSQRFMRSDRADWLVRTWVASGYLVVAVGILQHLIKPAEILWFYQPIDWSRVVHLAGPFVNPNHAGAFVGLVAILTAMHAHAQRVRNAQLVWGILTFPLVAYVFLVGARGAMVALLGGLCAWVLFLAVEGLSARRRALFTCVITALLLVGSAALLYWNSPIDRWIQDGTLRDKIHIWRAARHVPMHGGLFGLGPRGFQDAFAILGLNTSHVWVEDPESGPLQLAAEHGPVWTLVIVGLFFGLLYALQRATTHRRASLYAGLCAVMVYVGLEAITGMGLHASAYLLMVGALLGVAWGRARVGARAPKGARHLLPAWSLAALSIVVLAQSASAIEVSLQDSRVPLADTLRDAGPNAPDVDARARWFAQQTPGRAALLEQLALVYSARGDHAQALHMARALVRAAPNYAGAQRTAMRVTILADQTTDTCRLFQTYRERFGGLPTQELILWHEADGIDPSCFRSEREQRLVARAFLQADKSDLADSMILSLVDEPKEAQTATLIEAVRTSLRMDAPTLAEPWVQELQQRDLDAPQHTALLTWARDTKDPVWSYRVATRAQKEHPDDASFAVSALEAYVALPSTHEKSDWYQTFTERAEAAQKLTRGHPKLSRTLALITADAAWRANAHDDALQAYQDLEHTRLSKSQRIDVNYRLGELSRARGDYVRAQKYFRHVLEDAPKHTQANDALKAIGE